jgi:hypothetical protein
MVRQGGRRALRASWITGLAAATAVALAPNLGRGAVLGQDTMAAAARGAYVSGVAYDRMRGWLLGGAEVRLIGAGGSIVRDSTDALGNFRVGPVPAGEYRVMVLDDRKPGGRVAVTRVRLRAGEERRLRLVARLPAEVLAAEDSARASAATPAGGSTALIGVVKDSASGRELAGIPVRVLETGGRGVTTRSGTFFLSGLPSGSVRLEFGLPEGRMDTASIALAPGPFTFATVQVVGAPRQLPTLRVSVRRAARSSRLSGFYDRLSNGFGYYVAGRRIEELGMRGALLMLPQLQLDRCGMGCERIVLGPMINPRTVLGSASGSCPATIFLDGIRLSGGPRMPSGSEGEAGEPAVEAASFIMSLDPEDVAGVEAYPRGTGAPAEYQDPTGGCGVLLVWTK